MKLFRLVLFLCCQLSIVNCQLFAQWGSLNSNTNRDLNGCYFINEDVGCAVGDSGTILKTTNGNSWTAINNPVINTNKQLMDVFFTSSTNGFAVGSKGTVLQTSDGGSNWSTITVPTTYTMNAIYFFNSSNTGFIVGDVGEILKTTDGGSNWNTVFSGEVYSLTDINFLNGDTGFITVSNGTLLKTFDKGDTWTKDTVSNDFLSGIIFVNDSTGYISASNGKIFKTEDRGNNWLEQNSSSTEKLNAIDCADTICQVTGTTGTILKTIDEITWFKQYTGSIAALQDIFLVDEYTGYSVGSGGAILKSCPRAMFGYAVPTPGTVQFNDSSKNATQIEWEFGDGNKSSGAAGSSVTHTYSSVINFTVLLIAINETGCRDTTTLSFIPNGVEELQITNYKLQIYPNPFSNTTVLRITNWNELRITNLELKIFDLLGREVKQLIINNQLTIINSQRLPNGIYFYQITSDYKPVARGKLAVQ